MKSTNFLTKKKCTIFGILKIISYIFFAFFNNPESVLIAALNPDQIESQKKVDELKEQKNNLGKEKMDQGDFVPLDTTPLFLVEEQDQSKNSIDLKYNAEKITDLKSQIVSDKSISNLILNENDKDAYFVNLRIIHLNKMSSWYRLEKLTYYLDQKLIYESRIPNGLRQILVYEGMLLSGFHHVQIQVAYVGHGFGLFEYLNEKNVKIEGQHNFEIFKNIQDKKESDANFVLTSVGEEKGSFFQAFEDRTALFFNMQVL